MSEKRIRFRDTASFGKRIEYSIIGEMLKEGLDIQIAKEAEERRIKEEATREKKRKDKLEEERIQRNNAAALRESKYIGWTDAHTQGRWRSIHSEEYQQKMGKKDRGYY